MNEAVSAKKLQKLLITLITINGEIPCITQLAEQWSITPYNSGVDYNDALTMAGETRARC